MKKLNLRKAVMKRQENGWTMEKSPKEVYKNDPRDLGWFKQLDKNYVRKDKKIVVLTREIETEWGIVTHAVITSIEEPGWQEKQSIKNELFGEEAQAIEIFPKESQLVNDADSYHLWILPNNFKIPFTI